MTWKTAIEVDYNDFRGHFASDLHFPDEAPRVGEKVFAYNSEDQTGFDAVVVKVTEMPTYWIVTVEEER